MSGSDYWEGVDMSSKMALQARMRSGVARLGYRKLWDFYKFAWVNLPGGCQDKIYDVYSKKCWTPGTEQCGNFNGEGDCYNREHSWPKSWWSGGTGSSSANSDVFHVMPSDGYTNSMRSNYPFGEVGFASKTSSEGNKQGECATPGGPSGRCFEPTDRVKGTMARGHLYMAVRYTNLLGGGSPAVSGGDLKSWTLALMLKWNAAFPPAAWEVEFNNRAYQWQGNRNPFIDQPQLAQQIFG